MPFYSAFGLLIQSGFALPELVEAREGEADAVIKLGRVGSPSERKRGDEFSFLLSCGEAYLSWDSIGQFLVRGGKEIVIQPSPGAEESLVRAPLLGMVFATLLHQRGLLTLHASAVVINGGCVAFLGGKQWGKSTLAATLHARGHSLLSDDVVALEGTGYRIRGMGNYYPEPRTPNPVPQLVALSAFPQVKLWPDAVASLGADLDALPRLCSLTEKRLQHLSSGFSQSASPIRQIFVLGKGPTLEVKPLQPQEAIFELMRHTHLARFGNHLPPDAKMAHFVQCAEVARNVPVHRLNRPQDLLLVPSIARLVEEHLGAKVGVKVGVM
jgi:hypothetical protein